MQDRGSNKPPPKKRANPQPKQTGSTFGLPDAGAPFQGIGGPTLPSRARNAPNLTEQVALARARRERLQQGGLLSPAQRKAEELASTIVQTKAKFAAPPPGGRLTPAQVASEQRAVIANRPRLPHVAPRGVPNNPQIAKPGSNGLLGDLLNAASVGAGTAVKGAASIPSTLLTPIRPGATHTAAETIRPTHLSTATGDVARSLNKTAAGIQGAGLISSSEALKKAIEDGLAVQKSGADTGRPLTAEQIQSAGLSPQQTKAFVSLAEKRGWNAAELDGLVGLDLIKHAYSEPPNMLVRLAQNTAAGLIRTGGLVNLPAAAVQEIGSGHGGRFAKQLGEAFTSELPLVGKHNFADTFVADPYGASAILAGGLKTAGGVGGKLAEVGGRTLEERSVPLAGTAGRVVNRGVQSRNLYDASREMISDTAAKHSRLAGRRVARQEVDQVVADAANQVAPAHYASQKLEAEARKQVGSKRATMIQAAQMEGAVHADGSVDIPRLERVAADWDRRAAEDGPKSAAAGQARFLREKVIPSFSRMRQITRESRLANRQISGGAQDWVEAVDNLPPGWARLDPAELAYAKAHAELSGHTTSVMQERANFGDTAATYRRYQRPITVAAREGDPLARHIQEVRPVALAKDSTPEERAIYDAAVTRFAERHAAQGGAEPVRVKYTQPKNPNQYRHAGAYKQGFNLTPGRVHTSTGASAESGQYLIDPTSAQRENLAAQRLSQRIVAAQMIRDRVGQEVPVGTHVPEDMVFVPAKNFNTAGQVVNDLHENPVALDTFEADHAAQKSIHDALNADTHSTGWVTKEKGFLIPKAHWDRMHDYTRPESRNAYDRAMRSYQRLLIGTFPSTTLGNTLGTVPLGFLGQAGPADYAGALRLRKTPETLPHTTKGAGIAGALTGDIRPSRVPGLKHAKQAGHGYVEFMLRTSRKGEDITRQALYVHGMGGIKGMTKRASELGFKSVEDYAKAVAEGTVDKAKRDAALEHTIKFVGNMTLAEGKLGRGAGRAILFHRWVAHVAKLMLYTLPVEHPRRLALINALSQYGDQYRKDHGVWPSWMVTFSPLFPEVKGAQGFTKAIGLGQLAPQGTAGNIFDTLTQDQPWQNRLAGLASPPISLALNTSAQQITNSGSKHPVSIPWYVASQLAYALPGASKIAPRQGQAPDSVPFIHERQRYYTSPTGFPLSYDLRPGARPQQGPLGFASRAIGLPLYNAPNKGPVTAIQNAKEIQRDVKAYVAKIKAAHGG